MTCVHEQRGASDVFTDNLPLPRIERGFLREVHSAPDDGALGEGFTVWNSKPCSVFIDLAVVGVEAPRAWVPAKHPLQGEFVVAESDTQVAGTVSV